MILENDSFEKRNNIFLDSILYLRAVFKDVRSGTRKKVPASNIVAEIRVKKLIFACTSLNRTGARTIKISTCR